MFDITLNRDKHRIELTISGFLDTTGLSATERTMRDGVTEILRKRSDFDILVCVEDAGPASSDASAKMGELFGQIMGQRLRKAAHVGFSALATIQMRRVTGNDARFQFFPDRTQAENWLEE